MKKGNIIPTTGNTREQLLQLRESRGLTQSEVAERIGFSLRTYADFERGIERKESSYKLLERLSDFFEVSTDYILGRSKYTTPEKELVGSVTGLSDSALEGLASLRLGDENAIKNLQPALCVLPVLNAMLAAGSGNDMESLLRAIRQYIHLDYNIPVYHDGSSPVVSDSEYDHTYINTGTLHFLTFAKNKENPHDNIQIPVTADFLRSSAMYQVQLRLNEICETVKASADQC